MTETRFYEPARLSTPPRPLFSLEPLDANLVKVAAKWSLLYSMYPHVLYVRLARCKRDFPFFPEKVPFFFSFLTHAVCVY